MYLILLFQLKVKTSGFYVWTKTNSLMITKTRISLKVDMVFPAKYLQTSTSLAQTYGAKKLFIYFLCVMVWLYNYTKIQQNQNLCRSSANVQKCVISGKETEKRRMAVTMVTPTNKPWYVASQHISLWKNMCSVLQEKQLWNGWHIVAIRLLLVTPLTCSWDN